MLSLCCARTAGVLYVVMWRREGRGSGFGAVTELKRDPSHVSAAAALKWDDVVT